MHLHLCSSSVTKRVSKGPMGYIEKGNYGESKEEHFLLPKLWA